MWQALPNVLVISATMCMIQASVLTQSLGVNGDLVGHV